MTEPYAKVLRDVAHQVAADIGISLREGVYIALSGPTYETPAEIRAFRTLGADAVGMSTVPEVIAAAHMQIPVLGISCISNLAAGIAQHKLEHKEVMETTARVQKEFTALVVGVLSRLR
jgi:purine-nucleoside phosphorylase